MKEVSLNKNVRLSEHFTLGEVCKTKYETEDGNIPGRVAIENLRNICENWLHFAVRPASQGDRRKVKFLQV